MKLINQGQPDYGITNTVISEVNYKDYNYINPMGKTLKSTKLEKHYKHFQYFGVISDTLILGCGLVKSKMGILAFCYLYDVENKEMHTFKVKDIFTKHTEIVNTPNQGTSVIKKGKLEIRFINQDAPKEKALIVKSPDLEVAVKFSEVDFETMRITTRTGYSGWTYAQKVAGVPCEGTVTIKNKVYDMKTINAFAHHDWSGGFMRPHTFWNWACLSGIHQDKAIGLNLSCGVNETSYTENCFWIDQKKYKVDTVFFKYDADDLESEWEISSFDQQIKLVFKPLGCHQEHQNYIVSKSRFKQIFGTFEGKIGPLDIKEMYGFVEDQYVKW